jgi:hypothetical protein
MKLFEFTTTERNGEQEYSNNHLVQADSIEKARAAAIEYCKTWYDDEDVKIETDNFGYMTFIFFCGEIELELNDITETTEQKFCQEAVKRALIN